MDPSIWIIIDHKTGNANQAIAIAKAMGLPYETKTLSYNFLAHLPNWLKFNGLLGIKESISPPYPDLVISSGRKTASVNSYIKKKSPKSLSVHLMNPDLSFNNFDMILLPFHDALPEYQDLNNITYTIGAPSFLDKKKMQKEGVKLKKELSHLQGPFISLMIGGKTKEGDYTIEEMRNLIKQASNIANNMNGSLLISTSRRTSLNIREDIKNHITAPHFFYDWHANEAKNNPYLGFLSISDYIIVTGESISICSDGLATGKPVYIYRKDGVLYSKHRKFLDYLLELGYTKLLNKEASTLEQWEYEPLHEADRMAKIIKEKLKC